MKASTVPAYDKASREAVRRPRSSARIPTPAYVDTGYAEPGCVEPGYAEPTAPPKPEVVATHSDAGLMRFATTRLLYETSHGLQFIDITDEVIRAVADSGIATGMAAVYSRHTTAGIKINEHEPELLKDLKRFLEGLVPEDVSYYHNDFTVRWANMTEDESPNAHSHCRHLLLGSSESIPIVDGKLLLGRWQRIFLIELDHGRPREVVVQVMGC